MRFSFLLSLCLLSFQLLSQCTGNLGENIFSDGDFGSGVPNILQTNPSIAPGYGYTTFPPPQDGNYTITNNTSNWGSFAANWDNITDNSTDPNGYMMVINASFEPGLFYEQEVIGLCENTEFEFSADVYNLIPGTQGVILPNVTFLLDGQVQFQTGNVTGGQWNTYGFTFTTMPGQTSITLALQNNAPGGSGNDLALDNITFRACGPKAQILPEEISNICEDGDPITIDATIVGEQYDSPAVQWQQSFDQGLTWQSIAGETNLNFTHTNLTAGFYYYRYLLANGIGNLSNSKCRVNSNIKVIRVEPKYYSIKDTLCEGLILEVGSNIYDQNGTYIDSLTSTLGCDSIVTISLTIIEDLGIDPIFDIKHPSCNYEKDGYIVIENINNGTPPYQLEINNALADNFTLENLAESDINYHIIDKYGCILDTTISIIGPPPIVLDLGPDITVDLGDPIVISPTVSEPLQDYSLVPDGNIECNTDCETITWTPTQSTMVSLSALSVANGCFISDSILITVEKSRKIFFPNAFSPNDDNINDFFLISASIPNVNQIDLISIYDRWGNQIFNQENTLPNEESTSWDGYINGKLAPQGVYTYFSNVQFLDGEVLSYKGTLTLVR